MCAWLALASGVARAQGAPDTTREAEAKAYFLSGVELLKSGKLEAALEQFERSREVVPRAKNTINAAICLERLGRADEALERYREVRERYASEIDAAEQERLGTVIQGLTAKVGAVTVRSNVRDAKVQVNGRPRGVAGAPLQLMPGKHSLRIVAAGYVPFTAPVEIRAGEAIEIEASLDQLTRVGLLRVEDPASEGADVFVDQVLVGQIPWEGLVSTGAHVVSQRRGDRGSRPKAVTVIEGQTSLVTLLAEPLGAVVSLGVEPSSARLLLDDVPLVGGAWEGRLPRGRYRVRAEEPGYFSQELALEVGDEPTARQLNLAIDLEDARWPRAPRGDFLLGVLGGATFGGGLGSGGETGCPTSCPQSNPAFGYLVAVRVGYRFTTGTAIEALGGYGAATTSLLREVDDTFLAGGQGQGIHYQLAETIDLSFPFAGFGVSQRASLVGPLSLIARVTGGVAFAKTSPETQGLARTTGASVSAFVDGVDEPAGPIAFLQPEAGLELALGQVRLSLALAAFGLLGLTPDHGQRVLVVAPEPDPTDPAAVGNAPYSDAISGERSAGNVWLFAPQLGAAYAF